MNVGELIAVLEQYPSDMPVYAHHPSAVHAFGVSDASVFTARVRGGVMIEDFNGKRTDEAVIVGRASLGRSKLCRPAGIARSPHGE